MKFRATSAAGPLWLALVGVALGQYSSDNRYDPNRTHPSEIIADLQRLSPEQRVDTALALMKGPSDSGPMIATQILLQEKAEYVVPKIVDAITFDIQFEDEDRRRYAYIVLAAKQDPPYPKTFELLADGLIDYRVENVCLLGLEQTPIQLRGQAAMTLAGRLEHWYLQNGNATEKALEILSTYGEAGMPAYDMVKRVFLTPAEHWPQSRVKAGLTLAQIGGLENSVDVYAQMDTLQYQGALLGLAWLGEQTPWPYSLDSQRRARARKLVFEALAVPSQGVVREALGALPVVYGDSLYLMSGGASMLNQEVKSGLVMGAEKQPDAFLRSALVTALRHYEAASAKL